MRITITTGGSRGDTQPFVALGVGLERAGHEVTIATHTPYEDYVRARGLRFHPVFGDPEADMRRLTGEDRPPGPVRFAVRNRRNMERSLGPMVSDYLDACRGADAVVYTYPGFMGYFVGRELGVPVIGAFVEPLSQPTATFQSALLPNAAPWLSLARGGEWLTASYNRASHVVAGQLFWQLLRGPANRALGERLGTDPVAFRGPFKQVSQERLPAVFGFSPAVVGDPPDWGEHLSVTGFWFLDETEEAGGGEGVIGAVKPSSTETSGGMWEPPEELVQFVERGGDVVSIGLGSNIEHDLAALNELLARATAMAGVRAVLVGGWSGFGTAITPAGVNPDFFYLVDEVPYEWLFPRVAAAVHHGGAGTAASAFRAGVPQVVVPSYHAQPFWGSLVQAHGVGPEPLDRSGLSLDGLTQGIREAVSNGDMQARAQELGERVRAENGITNAVTAIERAVEEAQL